MKICKECGKEFDKLYAKGMCRRCYDKKYRAEHKEQYKKYRKQSRERRLGQYVYIVLCEDGGYYVGSTVDFYKRRKNHDGGYSTIPCRPLIYFFRNYPNLTTSERLELESCIILNLLPEHNRTLPTDGAVSDKIKALGNEFFDNTINGGLSVTI